MTKIIEKLKAFYNSFPSYIKFFLKTYLLGMVFFTIFRLALFFSALSMLNGAPVDVVLTAFAIGVRYDTVISGYLISIPFFLGFLINVIPVKHKFFKAFIFNLQAVLYMAMFAICAADIPYFHYYNSRITAAIFNWMSDTSIMWGMVSQNGMYVFFSIFFFILSGVFYYLHKKIYKAWLREDDLQIRNSWVWRLRGVGVFVLSGIIMFAAIRSRVFHRTPIKWGEAFFSAYTFPNQLGLNAGFTLGVSVENSFKEDKPFYKVRSDAEAIADAQKALGVAPNSKYSSPIARLVKFDQPRTNYNVVLVIMESMSRGFMGSSGNYKPSLTPFLDGLTDSALYFPNFYADGIHTFNGVWATLTSLPSLPGEFNAMKDLDNAQQFSGLPMTLYNNGYQTLFACPHDVHFDNMGGILYNNGFKTIISEVDVMNSEFQNTWGIPDHILFNKNFHYLNDLAKKGAPFFATFLTVSNHGPYALPKGLPADFQPRGRDIVENVVSYCDWSIKQFIDKAKKEAWFDNTIFVFVGDHGRIQFEKPIYEIDYWYKDIPMIIYAPKIIKPEKIYNLGLQEDIFPTVMSYLRIPYVNNTFGVNLRETSRPLAYFSANTDVGTSDGELYYVHKHNGGDFMYKYKSFDPANYIKDYSAKAEESKRYAFSMFHTASWMVKNKKVGFIKP